MRVIIVKLGYIFICVIFNNVLVLIYFWEYLVLNKELNVVEIFMFGRCWRIIF